MTSENVPAVVVRYFNAIGKMDPDAWVACFAEQGTSYEPGSPTPLQGHATLRQFLAAVLGAFEQIDMTEDHVFQSGNRVAVKFTGRGTGKNGRLAGTVSAIGESQPPLNQTFLGPTNRHCTSN